MDQVRAAIIGGTGTGAILEARGGLPVFVATAAGPFRGTLIEHDGHRLVLVSRHSAGHRVPPHAIAYRAIALGLKQLGVQWCCASAAVGSLRADWGPGTFALCTDFLDLTARNITLFTDQVVHTDMSEPFSPVLAKHLDQAALGKGVRVEAPCTYVCANGPRYETPGEVQWMRRQGGDVVGMTAATEAILLREAGIDYSCLAIVTNLGTGISTEPINHGDVARQMESAAAVVVDLFLETLSRTLA